MADRMDSSGLLYLWTKLKALFAGKASTSDAVKNITRSGTTFTATKADGNSFTFDQQDTWRGIQNNLNSDSTTDSLSAAQGKVLDGKIQIPQYIISGDVASTIDSVSKFNSILPNAGNYFIETNSTIRQSLVSLGLYPENISGDFEARKIASNYIILTVKTYTNRTLTATINNGTVSSWEELALNSKMLHNFGTFSSVSDFQNAIQNFGLAVSESINIYVEFSAVSSPFEVTTYTGVLRSTATDRYRVELCRNAQNLIIVGGNNLSGWFWDAIALNSKLATVNMGNFNSLSDLQSALLTLNGTLENYQFKNIALGMNSADGLFASTVFSGTLIRFSSTRFRVEVGMGQHAYSDIIGSYNGGTWEWTSLTDQIANLSSVIEVSLGVSGMNLYAIGKIRYLRISGYEITSSGILSGVTIPSGHRPSVLYRGTLTSGDAVDTCLAAVNTNGTIDMTITRNNIRYYGTVIYFVD